MGVASAELNQGVDTTKQTLSVEVGNSATVADREDGSYPLFAHGL